MQPRANPIAIMPPVEVPAMRSKYSQIGRPRSSSRVARKAAGCVPFMPPPSMQSMRRISGSLASEWLYTDVSSNLHLPVEGV